MLLMMKWMVASDQVPVRIEEDHILRVMRCEEPRCQIEKFCNLETVCDWDLRWFLHFVEQNGWHGEGLGS